MSTLNLDLVAPPTDTTPTAVVDPVTTKSPVTDTAPTTDEVVVTGSLSQTYTDILNKELAHKRIATVESINGYTSTNKPMLVYATDAATVNKIGATKAYESLMSAMSKESFSGYVISIEHNAVSKGATLALEEAIYDMGHRVYYSREAAINAVVGVNRE